MKLLGVRVIDPLLAVGWWCVMTLLPIGHITGLRNTVSTVVVLATLIWLGRDFWRGLPARWLGVALLGWCAASISWSIVAEVSFGKWRTDLLLPLLAYAAAFGYVRRTGRIDVIIGGTITGIGCLALLSLPALLPSDLALLLTRWLPVESFPNIANPLPIWYPGVGDASMAASLASASIVFAKRLLPTVPLKLLQGLSIVVWIFVLIIVIASNNRNAAIAIPAVVLFSVWLDRRRRISSDDDRMERISWRRIALVCLVTIGLVGFMAMLEVGSRQRLQVIGVPIAADQSALVTLTERDTRPMIWAYYEKLAMRAPIIGVGFGRTVPGLTYHTQDDRQLARVEFNAYIHAHNLFLNWWLQTGVVGVLLLVTFVGAIVIRVRRAGNVHDTQARVATITVVAIVLVMLIRNMTDDFLVFGMATMFWVLVGAFAAVALNRFSVRRDPS